MTDGGWRAAVGSIHAKVLSGNGMVALAGVFVLIVGIFLGSLVGRIVCGAIFCSAMIYLYAEWKKERRVSDGVSHGKKEDVYPQTPEDTMKKLLFDDFQSSGSKYLVKQVDEEEKTVVPSTKFVQPAPAAKEEKPKDFQIGDFFDLESDVWQAETEPRSEFNFLLTKALHALKEVLFAHSVAFFWANKEKHQLVLEARVTDSQSFMSGKRLDLDADVVSQVAMTGKPQLLGRINPVTEKEVVRYYDSPEYVKSFVGVPVYFLNGQREGEPVGVIVADNKAEDAFGAETFGLLGHFTKLVSSLIKSYTQKYDLLLDSELLNSIRRMQDTVKSDPSERTVLHALSEEAGRLVNWDFLTVAMYSDDEEGWLLHKVVNRPGSAYVVQNSPVDFQHSLVGEVIRTNRLKSIDDLAAVQEVRFAADEMMDQHGSFLAVPISSINRCYGALTLESPNPANFTGIEVETIYRLVESAASLLEVLYMNDMVKEMVTVDQLTGAFTKKHFLRIVDQEIARAGDAGDDLSYVSVAVDDVALHQGRYGPDGVDVIIARVAQTLRSSIRVYDTIGHMDADRFGLLLVNTPASDGYLWAEKIRKQIAGQVISIGETSLSVTVSAGLCGLTEGMSKEQLIAGTSAVLHRAIEDGGNLVRVY
jgi:diguanylate cyclase (GGDEF)-like protein